MSYGVTICEKCGGEVRVSDGYGGTCPNCGHWVSIGTVDSSQEQIDREMAEREILKERMKHTTRIVVCCSEDDGDRIREWSKEFTNLEDARRWARSQSGCADFTYYDENGRIE
jgi:predicted ATP-dependent serine protease